MSLDPAGPSQAGATLAPVSEERGIEEVALRLARILAGAETAVGDPTGGSELEFETRLDPRPFGPPRPAAETWAVDGGQALVADARTLQVFVTRAGTVCFRDGRCVLEEEGALRVHLLGGGAEASVEGTPDGTPIDVNYLRDRAEWEAAAAAVDGARPGAVVLIDGDLVPDWRLPATVVPDLLERAAGRGVVVAGVTKHSSLARGGAPLVGQLETEAAEALGPRARWWVPVARTREGSRWPDLRVVVARLDPDARYAFRIDLPVTADPEDALAALAAVADDAAFPGYPYPLSVADRLAACPGWLRAETWMALDEALERAGVPAETRERAFDDRHRLMERY